MRIRGLLLLALALLAVGPGTLVAQTPEVQQKVESDLARKRLQGVWIPDSLLTTEGAEVYPLSGRALYFDGDAFARIEGKRVVASGSFKVEDGYLRLLIKTRSPWDLEAAEIKERVQYTFKVDGDLLTLCYTPGNKAKAGDLTPGEGRQVVLYRRQRADAQAPQPPKRR